MPILETKNLTYTYSVGTPFELDAITDISIQIRKGELIGIIGQTGSGKSTLVQHLNGLLKPASGTVLLHGKDIWEEPKNIRSVRFKVGLVFQYPEHQLFEETVYKDIAFGPKNMGLSEEEIAGRVREAAAFAGLSAELLEKSPFQLSGGEKRRAAIAGVIAMRPEILILDEPTAGLDPKGRDDILDRIVRYQRDQGQTVLLVSHSMEDIARVAQRVLVIHEGKIAMFGPTEEVFSHGKTLYDMGLQVPQVTRICTLLQEQGIPIGETESIYTLEQATEALKKLLRQKEGKQS